jgi:hypothetical protein
VSAKKPPGLVVTTPELGPGPFAMAWCRNEILRQVLTDIANELRNRGALNEEECFIDATFAMAKDGGAEIGATGSASARDKSSSGMNV